MTQRVSRSRTVDAPGHGDPPQVLEIDLLCRPDNTLEGGLPGDREGGVGRGEAQRNHPVLRGLQTEGSPGV